MSGLKIFSATPPAGLFNKEIDEIPLTLFVWKDADDVYHHAYSPTDHPIFFSSKPDVKLRIDLIEPVSVNRFSFHSYFQSGKKSVKAVKGKLRSDMPGQPYKTPQKKTMFDDDTISIEFELNLPQGDQQQKYISILVADTQDGEIVNCDPQVENGTGHKIDLELGASPVAFKFASR